MTTIKKGEFVAVEYTGRVKNDNMVFDTTNKETAKKEDLHGAEFGPLTVCVGEGQVLVGLDKDLEGKEIGKDYTVSIKAEDAFGRKSGALMKIVPTSSFKKQNLRPMPGLRVNIDGTPGIIRTVTGGRTIVDFNHPLSGKEVVYDYKIVKRVTDDKEKLDGFLKRTLGAGAKLKTEVKDGNAELTLPIELPDKMRESLAKKITEVIPTIKKVDFITIKDEKPAQEGGQ